MAVEEDVLNIRKKLEKMIKIKTVDHSSAGELLKALQDTPVSLELLQKTKIGLTVNSLRKASTNEKLTMLCKSMIKTWKKLLSDSSKASTEANHITKKERSEKVKSPATVKKTPRDGKRKDEKQIQERASKDERRKDELQEVSTHQQTEGVSLTTKKKKKKKKKRKKKSLDQGESKEKRKDNRRSKEEAADSRELVRLKCQEMLADALKSDDSGRLYVLEPSVLAQLIEESIFEEFKDNGPKYKNRVRSRVANLKDTKHPALKENVLQGIISPDRFAKMTAEEMASDDMKDLRAKYTQEAINDHQMGKIDGTTSDLFSCEKCGSKKCTYKQVQLLCSDEPMTTFLLCYSCGYRWSFC